MAHDDEARASTSRPARKWSSATAPRPRRPRSSPTRPTSIVDRTRNVRKSADAAARTPARAGSSGRRHRSRSRPRTFPVSLDLDLSVERERGGVKLVPCPRFRSTRGRGCSRGGERRRSSSTRSCAQAPRRRHHTPPRGPARQLFFSPCRQHARHARAPRRPYFNIHATDAADAGRRIPHSTGQQRVRRRGSRHR